MSSRLIVNDSVVSIVSHMRCVLMMFLLMFGSWFLLHIPCALADVRSCCVHLHCRVSCFPFGLFLRNAHVKVCKSASVV